MAQSRVVIPEPITLTISNGDTLTVKKRLNAGEKRQQFDRMYRDTALGRQLDPLQTSVALILAYLIDWTFVYPDGKRMDYAGCTSDEAKIQMLDQIDYDDYKEVRDAIDAHEDAMEAERARQKKALSGEPASAITSGSAPGSVGSTNGSTSSTPTSTSS